MGTFSEKGDGGVSRVMESVFYADAGQHAEEEDDTCGEWCDIGEETVEE